MNKGFVFKTGFNYLWDSHPNLSTIVYGLWVWDRKIYQIIFIGYGFCVQTPAKLFVGSAFKTG